jgi:hypothetical protein
MGRSKSDRLGLTDLQKAPKEVRRLEACELLTQVDSRMDRQVFPSLEFKDLKINVLSVIKNGDFSAEEIVKLWNKFNELVVSKEAPSPVKSFD